MSDSARLKSRQEGSDLAAILEGLLADAVEKAPTAGAVLRIESPFIRWEGACGLAAPGKAMRRCDQFQIASITKMITAATAMILVEDGLLDLDRGIGAYLPRAVTGGLHRLGARSYGAELTTRQLLSHTSGVADFFGDGMPSAEGVLPFVSVMLREPDRLWQPLEILAWTKRNLTTVFPPGAGWHYSDTGYVVAGLVIETVAGRPLHEVMRDRVFAPLDMEHTFMLFREPARASVSGRPPSHAYVGEADYSAMQSVSADWASGGLVSTAEDLTRFIRAFAAGRLFRDLRSKAEMLRSGPTGEQGVEYGLGVRRFALDDLDLPGLGELWGHTGFLKSFMLYWPKGDATICGTLNQSKSDGAFSTFRPIAAVVPRVLRALAEPAGS